MRNDVKTEFQNTINEINFRLIRIEKLLKDNHTEEMKRLDELFNETTKKTGVFSFLFSLKALREHAMVTLPNRYLYLAKMIGSDMQHVQLELKDMNALICKKK